MEREGRPAVHDTFGVGQVLQHERTADGRYYLVLRGIWRARRLRELDTDKLYRVVEAGRLCDQVEDHAQVYALVETLRGCLLCLQANHPKLVGVLTRLFQEDEGPGPIADRLACVLFTDPVERQALLETRRVEARLQAIIDRLSELIARGCVPGSDALH